MLRCGVLIGSKITRNRAIEDATKPFCIAARKVLIEPVTNPMKFKVLFCVAVATISLNLGTALHASTPSTVGWQPWKAGQFIEARREKRLILLDLEAVWCHWCHVMEEKTYGDPRVASLLKQHFIAVKVDQDSRPDLGKRYEEYGWPATIVFDADGRELAKLRGYIEPERMLNILAGIVKDPSPREYADDLRNNPIEISSQALLSNETREELMSRFYRTHDFKQGGLNQDQKFMDRDSVELALTLAQLGDGKAAQMADQTLGGALHLIDPVWGGAYQYSTDGDWAHPHFEKIASVQADYLKLYANAAQRTGNRGHLAAAKAIHGYVKNFLTSPEGAFYVSQDADLVQGKHSEAYFQLDDAGRRSQGVPRVDTHVYARENGWFIAAFVTLALAQDDPSPLREAIAATRWIEKNRGLPGGGFRHDERDVAGPYLDDNLAMARAYMALHVATADRQWLMRADRTAQFIAANFRSTKGGFLVAKKRDRLQPRPNVDENIQLARLFNELSHYTGKRIHRRNAEHAMRYLATEEVATFRRTEPGILLADRELRADPMHITVVGTKRDANAAALYRAALNYPVGYRRIEWWDRAEGKLPNPDVAYPRLSKPAAFICSNKVCSSPIYRAEEVAAAVELLAKN